MQTHYSVKEIETRAIRDEAGFRGFLQHHQDSLNDVARGVCRQLLAAEFPSTQLVHLLTQKQRHALFSAVASSTSYTPVCSNGCGHEHDWADMPAERCGLCEATWNSIAKM